MSFSYDRDRYATPISSRPSVKIGGIDIRSMGLELTAIPNILLPPIQERKVILDNRSGSIDMGSVYAERRFTLEGRLLGLTLQDLVNKKNRLMAWIDSLQHLQVEWLVNQESVQGIPFEYVGHTLWYQEGTITTAADPTISGAGTKWTKYVSPGVLFEVAGDTTLYYVRQVISDSVLELTTSFSGTTGAGQAYRAERRRYLLCNYSGESSISSISDRGFDVQTPVNSSATVYNTLAANFVDVSIGFYVVQPLWIGDEFIHKETSLASGSFFELEGVGTSNMLPRIHLKQTSTTLSTPEIVSAKFGLVSNLNGNVRGTATDGTVADGTKSLTTLKFDVTKSGMGISLERAPAHSVRFENQVINHTKITALVRLRKNSEALSIPHNIIDIASDDTIGTRTDAWQILIGSDEQIYVLPRGASTNGSNILTTTDLQVATNDDLEVAFWYDSDGIVDEKDGITYYGKLFVNGNLEATETSAASNTPTITLKEVAIGRSFLGGSSNIGAIYDFFAVFNQALSDEEIRRIFTIGEEFSNTNTNLTLALSLAADDVLMIDKDQNVRLFDSSGNIFINNKSIASGSHPLIRGNERERATIFVQSASGTFEEIHFTYRPSWAS